MSFKGTEHYRQKTRTFANGGTYYDRDGFPQSVGGAYFVDVRDLCDHIDQLEASLKTCQRGNLEISRTWRNHTEKLEEVADKASLLIEAANGPGLDGGDLSRLEAALATLEEGGER